MTINNATMSSWTLPRTCKNGAFLAIAELAACPARRGSFEWRPAHPPAWELADKWQALGALLRYRTTLPLRLSDIAILVTGRACRSPFDWYAHRAEAEKAGIEQAIIEALLAETEPPGLPPDDAAVYHYAAVRWQMKLAASFTLPLSLCDIAERALARPAFSVPHRGWTRHSCIAIFYIAINADGTGAKGQFHSNNQPSACLSHRSAPSIERKAGPARPRIRRQAAAPPRASRARRSGSRDSRARSPASPGRWKTALLQASLLPGRAVPGRRAS